MIVWILDVIGYCLITRPGNILVGQCYNWLATLVLGVMVIGCSIYGVTVLTESDVQLFNRSAQEKEARKRLRFLIRIQQVRHCMAVVS